MRVILLGRKPVAIAALRHMYDRGAEIAAVVAPPEPSGDLHPERLAEVATTLGIPVVAEDTLYAALDGGRAVAQIDFGAIDLVVSILHQRRIRPVLFQLPRLGCVNFHPAPLPDYRGWGTYNVGILDNAPSWGASAHFVTYDFDAGPLILVRRFPVDMQGETALSLERRTQPVLLDVFREVFERVWAGQPLPRTDQGPGRYVSKADFLRLRRIDPRDIDEVVERKTRAFWYPPYQGAEVVIAGRTYTLIGQPMLSDLGRALHTRSGQG